MTTAGENSRLDTMHKVSHDDVVDSALGFGSRHQILRPGRVNCVEAQPPNRVTAVVKLLTLICLGGDCPSFTLSSDSGMSVVFNEQTILKIILHALHNYNSTQFTVKHPSYKTITI